MVKILIVEDNEYKLEKLKNLLCNDIQLDSIDTANCTKTAKQFLMTNQYDLLILDLVLPLESDSESSPRNGIVLLDSLIMDSRIKTPFYLFGLSEYSDKIDENKEHFNNGMWQLIHYDATSYDWADKISRFVLHLIAAKEKFLNHHKSIQMKYDGMNSQQIIEQVLKEFSNTIKKITVNRRKGHPPFEINNEYDVQDLVYVMLKGVLPSLLKEEEPTPIVGGKYNRIDFTDTIGTLIEIKMMKEKDSQKEFIEQLKIDIQSYYLDSTLKTLIFFIYDPFNKTKDKHQFYDLEGEQVIKGISFMIQVILCH